MNDTHHPMAHIRHKPEHNTASAHAPHPHVEPAPHRGVTPPPLPGPAAGHHSHGVSPATHPVFATLLPQIQRAVAEEGYLTPTPIQVQAIPHLLAGRDLLGCAQTGTGKTAAFALPILQYLTLNRRAVVRGLPRVLILAPTRELAAQIGDSFRAYGRHLRISHTVIFGGVAQHPQEVALGRGVDIVVATPGRLLDLMQQGLVRLDAVEIFVLDEADRMLDMGFIRDIRRIISKLPSKRQSLFFSATLQPEVISLARTLVHDAVHVTIAPEQPTVEKIAQKVLFVDRHNKDAALVQLLKDSGMNRVLVFVQMKHIANRVCAQLERSGIRATAIHSNKSQSARLEALGDFRTGKVQVLVATDIAARGLDIDDITHVINYHLPVEPGTYIHRIGRTARAGAGGDAISLCSSDERDALRAIERLLGKPIPVVTEHAFHSEIARNAKGLAARPAPRMGGRGGKAHPFRRFKGTLHFGPRRRR